MQITTRLKRTTMAVLGVTALGLAAGAPAQASDVSLRKAITQQEKRVAPLTEEFAEALETPTSAVGIERLRVALADLQDGTSAYRRAVVKQKATVTTKTTLTATKVRRGRADYILALGSVAKALITYREGFQNVLDEKINTSKTTFKRAGTELKAANVKIDRAAKLIGVKVGALKP